MALKYEKMDKLLLRWFRQSQANLTTAHACQAVGATSPADKKHVSRRFNQLEERGTLSCYLQGTERICAVVGDLPAILHKQRKATAVATTINQNILAANSDEFVAAGGIIEHLPAAWDAPDKCARQGSLPLGAGYAVHYTGVDLSD